MRLGVDSYDKGMDIRLDVRWHPPGLFLYKQTVSETGAGESGALQLVNLHMLTPETEYTTHYLFRAAVLNTNDNPAILDFWRDIDILAFNEDKSIIEAQQKMIGQRDLFAEPLWGIQGDQMSIRGRRILSVMAGEQTGQNPIRAIGE